MADIISGQEKERRKEGNVLFNDGYMASDIIYGKGHTDSER